MRKVADGVHAAASWREAGLQLFFIIGLFVAICEQHKTHGAVIEDEDNDQLDNQTTIVISQEVPSVFDTFSSK